MVEIHVYDFPALRRVIDDVQGLTLDLMVPEREPLDEIWQLFNNKGLLVELHVCYRKREYSDSTFTHFDVFHYPGGFVYPEILDEVILGQLKAHDYADEDRARLSKCKTLLSLLERSKVEEGM